MVLAVKSRLIKIGNSQGFRIPKPFLEQCGIDSIVEISVEDDRIVIQPAKQARDGWDEKFALMAERGDDKLLDEVYYSTSSWDEDEWEW